MPAISAVDLFALAKRSYSNRYTCGLPPVGADRVRDFGG